MEERRRKIKGDRELDTVYEDISISFKRGWGGGAVEDSCKPAKPHDITLTLQ